MIQNYSQFMTNSQYLFHQKCEVTILKEARMKNIN